jgi:hypothetical protein
MVLQKVGQRRRNLCLFDEKAIMEKQNEKSK